MEEIQAKSIKELREILKGRNVDFTDCIEKGDLIAKVIATADLVTGFTDYKPFGTIATLNCNVLGSSQKPDAIVIISHGFGANAQNLLPIAQEFLKSPSLQNVKFVVPDASIGLGNGGYAWWPLNIPELVRKVMSGQIDQIMTDTPAGLVDASNTLQNLVKELMKKYNLPYKKVILAGFSQGAILSVDVALHLPEPVGGLAIFSGVLQRANTWKSLAPSKSSIKVLQSHGKSDSILPYVIALKLRDMFVNEKYDIDFVSFDGAHSIPQEAIEKFSTLVQKVASS